MNSPRLTPHRLGVLALAAIVGASLALAGWRSARTGEPSFEGRSAQSWFRQLCRASDEGSNGPDDPRVLDAKVAFLRMGSNAVPMLVDEAFTFRRDGFLRSNLHELFLHLPEWAGRGAFVPYHAINHQAASLLRALRPPAGVLMPLLEPHFTTTNTFELRHTVYLLGTLGEGADRAMPHLTQCLTNDTDTLLSALSAQSIRWLGARASNALPAVLADMNTPRPRRRLIDWLAQLGPVASPAMPLLEETLQDTNSQTRVQSAVALINIQPDHRGALQVLTEAADLGSSDQTVVLGLRRSWEDFVRAVAGSPGRPNDHLAALLEPLARAEVNRWGPLGASFEAILALERIAPSRASILYQSALDRPGAVFAAGALLRLERTNEAWARKLVEILRHQNGIEPNVVWYLGEASSSNRVAITNLEAVASVGNRNRHRGGADSMDRLTRQNAVRALARIRYREARVAMGLPEGEWP